MIKSWGAGSYGVTISHDWITMSHDWITISHGESKDLGRGTDAIYNWGSIPNLSE